MALSPNRRHDREPRLADDAAYARCFAQWSESAYGEVVGVYQLGYLQPGARRWRRRRPVLPIPMLQLVVEPGESIDFADPVRGFPGLGHEPPPDRVLNIWADDLLSVSHGKDWTFVIEALRPFERSWLDLLVPPRGATRGFWHAIVGATFAGPARAGRLRVADLDATTYLTRVHIADHRESTPRVRERPVPAHGRGHRASSSRG